MTRGKRAILALTAVAAALGACDGLPTALIVAPDQPSAFSTGYTYGSGNRTEPDTTATATASLNTVAEDSSGGGQRDGGYTYGSGN